MTGKTQPTPVSVSPVCVWLRKNSKPSLDSGVSLGKIHSYINEVQIVTVRGWIRDARFCEFDLCTRTFAKRDIKQLFTRLYFCTDSLQCLDTVGWATGRASGLYNAGCWFVGGDDLTAALHEWVSEWVSRVYRPHQHIIGHFGDESFQSITCTGTITRTTKRQNTQIT